MLVPANSIAMAAAIVGGAVLGAVASELLRGLIRILKELKNKDKNLQELESHLHRLEPCVEELRSAIKKRPAHPAQVWLDDLERELKASSKLVADLSNTSRGPILRARISRGLVPVNARISKLMHDAVVANWASTLSTIDTLSQSRTEDRKVLDDIRATQEQTRLRQDQNWSRLEQNWGQQEQVWGTQERVWEKQKQVWGRQAQVWERLEQVWKEEETFRRQMSQAIEFQPSHLREREIKRAASSKFYVSNYASSSSANRAEYQHQADKSDTSKPKVDFGGDLVAEGLIADLVHQERYTKWIGLWAMGGAGKTFVARKIYNDPRIKQRFSGGQFWVTESKHGRSAHFLLQDLFEQIRCRRSPIDLQDAVEERTSTVEEKKIAVKNLLDRDNILLVMDDVWESKTLETLDVISEERRGVILVTTRDDRILRRERAKIVEIPRLSPDHSWQLFSWYAFHDHGRNLPSDLEFIAKDVVAECQGLPLALEVIGASMRDIHVYSGEKKQGRSLGHEWKRTLEQLRSADVSRNEYNNLFERLQLSVENLCETDVHLQECFFDVAAFPEDWEIAVEDLVNMWIAAGSMKADADSKVSNEDEARYLVGLLVAKSMIKLVSTEDASYCKVHDMMRDLVRRNLKMNLKTNEVIDVHERKCLYASGLGIEEFPKSWNILQTTLSVEKLSLFGNNLARLPEYFNAPNLRILILQENKNLSTLPPGFFGVLSNLRVLNLARTSIETISDGVVDNLKSLVLLDVRWCRNLRTISHRIEDLGSLETILLEGSKFKITITPPKSLRTFYGNFEDQVCRWRSLRNLRLFCKSHVSSISSLVGLEVLDLDVEGGLPADVMQLRHLRILKVKVSWADDVALPCLGELPQLEVLWLEFEDDEVAYFPPSFAGRGAFPCLKELKLDITHEQEGAWFRFHPGTMPRIQTLTIASGLPGSIPPKTCKSLRELRNLVSLTLRGFDAESLDLIFREPNRFPNLENITFSNDWETSTKLPTGIGALPTLGYVECSAWLLDRCQRGDECRGYDCPELKCPHVKPPRVLELEKQGKLEVKLFSNRGS